jgi:hypothetical protein
VTFVKEQAAVDVSTWITNSPMWVRWRRTLAWVKIGRKMGIASCTKALLNPISHWWRPAKSAHLQIQAVQRELLATVDSSDSGKEVLEAHRHQCGFDAGGRGQIA